jgi:hypothetical protein
MAADQAEMGRVPIRAADHGVGARTGPGPGSSRHDPPCYAISIPWPLLVSLEVESSERPGQALRASSAEQRGRPLRQVGERPSLRPQLRPLSAFRRTLAIGRTVRAVLIGRGGSSMPDILLHNEAHASESQARAHRLTANKIRGLYWWNIWQRRLKPYGLLANGSQVLLLDSWPGGGEFTWLVHARTVHTNAYPSKSTAVRAIADWAKQDKAWVLGDPYTAAKPNTANFVIAWRARPVQQLSIPRPPDLKVGRHGWLVLDGPTVEGWGVALTDPETSKKAKGQLSGHGARLDVATKDAVENRAVIVAKQWCRKQNWASISNVGSHQSWDLEALDAAGQKRYIEVKGTTGLGASIEVTRNEVTSAQGHGASHALAIVHSIKITLVGGRPKASGGTLVTFDPWRPTKSELTAQRYSWKASPSRRPGGRPLAAA